MSERKVKMAPKFSTSNAQHFQLTFEGFLAVRLMEFDYGGRHYSYHGKKLANAVERLPFDGQFHEHSTRVPSTAELVIWGQAVHDWKAETYPARPADV